MDDPKAGRRKQFGAAFEASALAFMFPIAIGIGYLWGYWMDRMFGTRPWLTVIFTACGIIAAFLNLFRFALRNDDSSGSDKHRTQ